MKKNYCFVWMLICLSWCGFSQTNTSNFISERYKEHFQYSDEESVFVHLNKTSYLVGEEIWFKAYTFSKKSEKLSQGSTNLYIGLYNTDGDEMMKKLIHLKGGMAYGNLELDKKLSSGVYYIKALTQYMMETQPTEAFIEEIRIYGTNVAEQSKKINTTSYDLQFLPEGGHLVSNVENTVGFKAINQEGKGVYVSGVIYDESNTEVTSFESNTYGIGTFTFTPKSNQTYTAKTIFKEETTSEQTIPKSKDIGIAIQVNNIEKDSVKIVVNTNKETLRTILSKNYTLFIHKDGKARSMPLTFQNNEKVALTIPRNRLFNGVNTITLFDGKTPLLERLFFNPKVVKNLPIMLKKNETENDYSRFSLYLIKRRSGILDANVSISILPETTEAYNPANSIYSSFYLKPYVRGAIENPKYYFPNTTKTKREDLDALLITQGWSAYDWTDIFQGIPKKGIPDKGVTISGTVNFPVKRLKGILLQDMKEHPAQFIKLDKERKFTIKNLYPQADEELRFSAVDFSKKFLQPKLYLTYSATTKKDQIVENTPIDRSFLNKNIIFKLPDGFFPDDAVDLDEVLLKGKNNRTKETTDPMMVNGKETKFGEKEYMQYPQVRDFIESSGYDVFNLPLDPDGVAIFTRKRLTLETGDPPGYISPLIFVDGAPLSDFSLIRNFSTAEVDRIIVDKTGQGYGMRGVGGVIKIFTRKDPLTPTTPIRRDSYSGYTPPIGFSVPKQYYEPKYPSYTSDTYQKFGVLDWRPKNIIPRRGPFSFTVKHKDVKAITFFIEGISRDGSLISEKRTITIVEDE